MQWRETNHLRKYANEAGKQMRGSRRQKRTVHVYAPDPQCSRCQYKLSSHLAKFDREWSLKNGMCEEFQS